MTSEQPQQLTIAGTEVYDYDACHAYAQRRGRGTLWTSWYNGQAGLLSDGRCYVYASDWERFLRWWMPREVES